jgi:two-component system CheB/CheR fusion protein
MEPLGLGSYAEYRQYLESHPEEYSALFNTILINLTAFFRDPVTWDYVSEEVIPRIVTTKNGEEPIRIWSAGCSSGEEAYTTAMVFAEKLGIGAFLNRVKLYATDIDDIGISKARHGRYSAREVIPVPSPLLGNISSRRTGTTFSTRTCAAT